MSANKVKANYSNNNKQEQKLRPTEDFAFKRIFGSEDSKNCTWESRGTS